MTPDDWAAVMRIPLFRAIGEPLVRSILRGRSARSYDRGEAVFHQGDIAASFFLVLDGWIKLYRQLPNGDEVVVALLTKGETFAEAMMFLGGRYPASAEAVSPTRLLQVDGAALRDAIMRNPQISFEMLAASSLHLRRLVEQIEQLKAQSAPKRIAGFLLSLITARSGAAQVALPYEKSLIAKRLGMKPESFSRALAKLRGVGISVQREFVHVNDVARLAAFVRGDDGNVIVCPVIRRTVTCSTLPDGCVDDAIGEAQLRR
jgi:CRP-like cAMP-binding protein